MIGIAFALSAAIFWGGGDFSGGFASRRNSPFQVLAVSALAGVCVLFFAELAWRENMPSTRDILWSLLAGAAGTLGITSLYRGLSVGNSATVAPTSAVIGAALPVCFTFFNSGFPAPLQLAGFALAFAGIWLVSRPAVAAAANSRAGFWLACLAGLGFGSYFIFIGQVEAGKVIIPLLLARITMFLAALIILQVIRIPFPQIRRSPIALLAGALDAGGNVLFLLARQFTRLDTAVIISSLYPAVTVILSAIIVKEKISSWQKIGVICCLVAITLITL